MEGLARTAYTGTMKRSIIDSHCHVHFPQYDQDRDAVIRRALDAGVRMITVGTNESSTRAAIGLAEQYEGIWASIGVHPGDTDFIRIENMRGGNNRDDASASTSTHEYEWMKLCAVHPKVVAVGEVGFDYFSEENEEVRARQRAALAAQLDVARQYNLPAILHCRNAKAHTLSAYRDALELLDEYDVRGVFHSFTGGASQAGECIAAGHCIGLNAIATFSGDYKKMVQSIPTDRLLLETDAPYLAPDPHRGKRNEPSFIYMTVDKIAEMRGESPEATERTVSENAARLFHKMNY